ncbi:MAG: DUF4386 domain-containing protein [Spirochaetia bacterium]
MTLHRKEALIVGMLFLLAIVTGVASLSLIGIADDPEYLIAAAERSGGLLFGALLVLIMAFACAGISIWLYPVLRRHNRSLALGAVGFRIIEAVFHLVTVLSLLLLVTLSRRYLEAGVPEAPYFEILGALLQSTNDWAGGVVGTFAWLTGAFMYYLVFYRSKLIPRWLSLWGILGVIPSAAATLLSLFGVLDMMSGPQVAMVIPLAAQEAVLGVWLIMKGFDPEAVLPEGEHAGATEAA